MHYGDGDAHWHKSLTVGGQTRDPNVHPGDSVVVKNQAGGASFVVAEVTGNGTLLTNTNMAVKPSTSVDIYCPGHSKPQGVSLAQRVANFFNGMRSGQGQG